MIKRIAILGGSGTVGTELIKELKNSPQNYEIKASYHSNKPQKNNDIKWHNVDLLEQSSVKKFVKDADCLIYLVHALNEKNYLEKEQAYAQNTAEALKNSKVKKIIYLGGLTRQKDDSDTHLYSKKLAGETLAYNQIPLAELRASIILHPESDSFLMPYYLAKRLPIMLTPKWLKNRCMPIDIKDVTAAIHSTIQRDIKGHEIFEIGSEVMTYKELLHKFQQQIHGKRKLIMTTPLLALSPSALWIKLTTGVNYKVAQNLATSMKVESFALNNEIQTLINQKPIPISRAIKKYIKELA